MVGDPFSGGIMGGNWKWDGEVIPMPYKKELSQHVNWTINHTPKFKRAKYIFEIFCGDDKYIFTFNYNTLIV